MPVLNLVPKSYKKLKIRGNRLTQLVRGVESVVLFDGGFQLPSFALTINSVIPSILEAIVVLISNSVIEVRMQQFHPGDNHQSYIALTTKHCARLVIDFDGEQRGIYRPLEDTLGSSFS